MTAAQTKAARRKVFQKYGKRIAVRTRSIADAIARERVKAANQAKAAKKK